MKKKLVKRTKADDTVYYIVYLGEDFIRVFVESEYDKALELYTNGYKKEVEEILMQEEI